MRKTILVLILALSVWGASAQGPDLNIIHFNDVYEIEPVSGGALGGAARVATLINERAGKNPLILFSGDAFSPSIMSSIFKGQQMVDVFNRLGLDYATVGNHELDLGLDVAVQRIGESEFPWMAANLFDDSGQPYAGSISSTLVDWNGVKVGIFGLVGNWLDLVGPNAKAQYSDFIAAGQTIAQDLKAQGAQVIIAVTHMEMDEDRALAQAVPDIDLILGGHDHDPMNEVVNETLIWKTGSDFRTLGELKVFLIPGQKALILPNYIPVTASVAEEPAMAAVVAGYAATLDAELGQPIGDTQVALDATRAAVRTTESNFGNLITDASRAFTSADVAIMNGGGIRTDQMYGPGQLTRRDIQAVLPFGNVVIVVELSGADLVAALENGISEVEKTSGRFPQISGATYKYDPSLAPGQRILEVTVAGQPLDPAKTYSVAINDFIGSGGDGYEVFINAPRLLNEAGGPLLAEVVMNYVLENGSIAPGVEGRITTP
jgi:2',3'-cyclic-nucleotide 2'-phosphodiesterase (5'-nucleotidase family)